MSWLVRDENNEPVRVLVTRDRQGRFIKPYYGFIWPDSEMATEAERSAAR